ncbi:FHA domain-containing protein [Streptomyces sp. MS2A]|nr:FHA domain-containing protein [Streptomyces sp. MS2A]
MSHDDAREPAHSLPEPTRGGTTHAAWGAGNPRLLVSREDERQVFDLVDDRTAIGSAPDAQLRLDGADPVHATIRHDDRDEYVLELHAAGEMNARPDVSGTDAERGEILRTGARFTVADWTLVFQRDEFADHGRPYGGREGGELSDQPPQPARPDYRRDEPGDERPLEVHDS